MIQHVLAILAMISILSVPATFAFSADLQEKTKPQENNKELSAPDNGPLIEKGHMVDGNFLNDVERFLESQLPDTWEGWRHPRYWSRPLLGALLDRHTLRVDVIEQENNFVIRAELPGVDKKDIHVTISDNLVTIEADTSKEVEEEKGSYYRREISRGAYSRTLMLPVTVDGNGARASFKSGVLQLTIPKMEVTNRITIEVE